MTPRNAAGMSPEELRLQDAHMDGVRAGNAKLAAGLNPFDIHDPRYVAWEEGRMKALAQFLARSVA